MNKNLLLFLLIVCLSPALRAQQFISSTLLGTKTQNQLTTVFNLPFIQYGVTYYRITYTTTNLQGQLDTVSGLLVAPNNNLKVFPRLVYQHGTAGSKLGVPSFNVNNDGEGQIGWLFAGLGYVALLPDYLGLGVSDGFHPYVHAASEASVAVDMLRASQTFMEQNGMSTNDQLFVTGYSQGGHAAMALHREIQANLGGEFTVTASAPMSGPYSISGVMRDLILNDGIYYYPAYIPNTALSYQTAYGNIFNQLTDVFKPAYAGMIGDYYDNTINLGQLNDQLIAALITNEGASTPIKMLQPALIQELTNNPSHPINVALADNDVYNWTPQAPTRLFYCTADDQVPFMNSIVARDTIMANGSPDFAILDVNPAANHGECVTPALTNTIFFFAGFQQIGTVATSTPLESGNLELLPNPAQQSFRIKELPGAGELTIIDYGGKTHVATKLDSAGKAIDVSALPNGIYLVRYTAKGNVWQEKLVVQH